jgi:hypothetical protein
VCVSVYITIICQNINDSQIYYVQCFCSYTFCEPSCYKLQQIVIVEVDKYNYEINHTKSSAQFSIFFLITLYFKMLDMYLVLMSHVLPRSLPISCVLVRVGVTAVVVEEEY